MTNRKLHVPAFRDDTAPPAGLADSAGTTDGKFTSVVVIRWGRVAGFTFRAGDRLVLEETEGPAPGRGDAGLLLLRPCGYGWPMLGRRVGGRLVAEPGGVPAAPSRWRIAARVRGVERRLGRSVTDRGVWSVQVRACGTTTPEALSRAGLEGGRLTNREVDALCHRAARWMDDGHGSVAVGVAERDTTAAELAAACPAGRLRIEPSLPAAVAQEPRLAHVVVGPWGPSPVVQPSPGAEPMRAADGTRFDAPERLPSAEPVSPAAQLSLFGSSRSHRAS